MVEKPNIALVQMPFAMTSWPSLGLSLLKANLAGAGYPATILYLNYVFASLVGQADYLPISLGKPQACDLLGEWVFADALWGPHEARDRRYFHEVLLGKEPAHKKYTSTDAINEIWGKASRCRAQVSEFIKRCLSNIKWNAYDIVGFTSVFQQNLASLALARELKKLFPKLFIVFGGANCEDEMGLATLKNFGFIDAVCSGEGDLTFADLVKSISKNTSDVVPGIIRRDQICEELGPITTPKPINLNLAPYPDFDDFFEQCASSQEGDFPMRLLFETSRGCWWGQKSHCTFCGLNGKAMGFRQKTGDRAIEEIEFLIAKYGHHTKSLAATDNIIPFSYFDDFLPKLISLEMNLNIFYETKANLRKDHLVLYRKAGLTVIQPGIESLDTRVLKLMKKGVSALQNLQLLKWCKELGILPHWNYLFGFPMEEPAWYAQLPALVRRIRHLTPPLSFARLRFDRFSPYVSAPGAFGINDLVPYPAYAHVYPGVPDSELRTLAYYFVGRFFGQDKIDDYVSELRREITIWQTKNDDFMLAHVCGEEFTVVLDSRNEEGVETILLKDNFHWVHSQCESITSVDRLCKAKGMPGSTSEIVDTLRKLENIGLVVREGAQYLALSVPMSSAYKIPGGALSRLQRVLGQEETEVNNPIRIPQENTREYSSKTVIQ
jgi:ribosomal peptide maturation radical SAM protein 1